MSKALRGKGSWVDNFRNLEVNSWSWEGGLIRVSRSTVTRDDEEDNQNIGNGDNVSTVLKSHYFQSCTAVYEGDSFRVLTGRILGFRVDFGA